MPEIHAYDNSNIEVLIKQFKKKVTRENILVEIKKRRYYIKPSQEKHEKRKKLERKKMRKIDRNKKLY